MQRRSTSEKYLPKRLPPVFAPIESHWQLDTQQAQFEPQTAAKMHQRETPVIIKKEWETMKAPMTDFTGLRKSFSNMNLPKMQARQHPTLMTKAPVVFSPFPEAKNTTSNERQSSRFSIKRQTSHFLSPVFKPENSLQVTDQKSSSSIRQSKGLMDHNTFYNPGSPDTTSQKRHVGEYRLNHLDSALKRPSSKQYKRPVVAINPILDVKKIQKRKIQEQLDNLPDKIDKKDYIEMYLENLILKEKQQSIQKKMDGLRSTSKLNGTQKLNADDWLSEDKGEKRDSARSDANTFNQSNQQFQGSEKVSWNESQKPRMSHGSEGQASKQETDKNCFVNYITNNFNVNFLSPFKLHSKNHIYANGPRPSTGPKSSHPFFAKENIPENASINDIKNVDFSKFIFKKKQPADLVIKKQRLTKSPDKAPALTNLQRTSLKAIEERSEWDNGSTQQCSNSKSNALASSINGSAAFPFGDANCFDTPSAPSQDKNSCPSKLNGDTLKASRMDVFDFTFSNLPLPDSK